MLKFTKFDHHQL